MLIVGLGNPGLNYQHNRHNIGFLFLDYLIAELAAGQLNFKLEKNKGLIASFNYRDKKLYFLKPQNFINLSGQAVVNTARYYQRSSSEIIVIHDDLDLSFGQIKSKLGGGHAGHNGLRNIDQQLASKDYWRLRLGIDHPRNLGLKMAVADYVLSDFSKPEQKALDEIFAQAYQHLLKIID